MSTLSDAEKLKVLQTTVAKLDKLYGKGTIIGRHQSHGRRCCLVGLDRIRCSLGRWWLPPRAYHRDIWTRIVG